MEPLAEALASLKEFLQQQGVGHMVVGGLANSVWGQPRFTADADVVVLLGGRSIAEFVESMATGLRFRQSDPVQFAQRTYVLPIRVTDEVSADLLLALLPYGQCAIERAVLTNVEGVRVPVCTAEDLIIYKAISERPRHWMDTEGVLVRQGDQLDQEYILGWLEQCAQALERPGILSQYDGLRAMLDR
jgi:hypothetical protein